jgi:hypothetical protein
MFNDWRHKCIVTKLISTTNTAYRHDDFLRIPLCNPLESHCGHDIEVEQKVKELKEEKIRKNTQKETETENTNKQ